MKELVGRSAYRSLLESPFMVELRFYTQLLWRMFRYGLAGLLNTAAGGGTILFMQFCLHAPPPIANAAGYVVGVPLSFVLSRIFVFQSNQSIQRSSWRFFVSVAIAFCVNQLVLAVLTPFVTTPFWEACAQGASLASYSLTLFFLSHFFVFSD